MSVKTHSGENEPDLTPDEPSALKTPKSKTTGTKRSRGESKSPRHAAPKKKKAIATDPPVQSSQVEPFSMDADLGEPENATGPFTDYIVDGPKSSKGMEGMTKHATLPSAPLVSATPGPAFDKGQGQYYLFFVSSPVESLVKSKLPVDFEKSSTVTIGRDSDNAIVIPDQVVSRSHAELVMQDGWVFLRDLQSTNGTFVYDGTDFQPVQDSVEVKPNSVIRFGNHTIVKLVRE